MARARNIKPSLFKNEFLGTADPLLTILFTGLWCLADKEGRLEDRPLRIKAEVFPYREGIDINGYLTELERLGFIRRYSAEDKRVVEVLNFIKHQNPHHTERASELPEFSDSCHITVNSPLNTESTPADSLLLIPDSPIPSSRDFPNQNGKPKQLPNKIESEICLWLDSIAAIIPGAKDGKDLADYKRWREVAEQCVRSEKLLPAFLETVRTEFSRTRGTPQFFTPITVLKAFQNQGEQVATVKRKTAAEYQAEVMASMEADRAGN